MLVLWHTIMPQGHVIYMYHFYILLAQQKTWVKYDAEIIQIICKIIEDDKGLSFKTCIKMRDLRKIIKVRRKYFYRFNLYLHIIKYHIFEIYFNVYMKSGSFNQQLHSQRILEQNFSSMNITNEQNKSTFKSVTWQFVLLISVVT